MTGILVTKLVSYSKEAPMPTLCSASISEFKLLSIFICDKYAYICKTAVLRIYREEEFGLSQNLQQILFPFYTHCSEAKN